MSALLSCDTILGHTPNRMSAMTPNVHSQERANSTIFIGPVEKPQHLSPDRRTMAYTHAMEYFTDKRNLPSRTIKDTLLREIN